MSPRFDRPAQLIVALSVVFGEGYGYGDGTVGLMFCSVLVGLAMALVVTPFLEKKYIAVTKAKGGKADPEDRLPGMMLGAPFVPICTCSLITAGDSARLHIRCAALFIFGWTAPPYVMPHGASWVGPCISGKQRKDF